MRARASMAAHCAGMVAFLDKGAEVFDYGNNLRAEAEHGGFDRAFAYPGFIPAYIRPLFCEGKGPFRWAALSGDPGRHRGDRSRGPRGVPRERAARALDPDGGRAGRLPGLARAGSAGSGYGERHRLGVRFNELVASGEVQAPIVIGRDHLDAGSVASPYRETESMADGSDAIADWPLLNALVNTASGASWVSIHHGGGVGIGRSIHAGQVVVVDGTELAAAQGGARADERPRDGRAPSRRRRLRGGRGGGRRARRAHPDGGGLVLVDRIGELVTNDASWGGMLGIVRDAAVVDRRRSRRLGRRSSGDVPEGVEGPRIDAGRPAP